MKTLIGKTIANIEANTYGFIVRFTDGTYLTVKASKGYSYEIEE